MRQGGTVGRPPTLGDHVAVADQHEAVHLAAQLTRFRDAESGMHLERVSRFFIEDQIPEVGGGALAMKAHDYGAVVLVYGYVDHFFPARDVTNAASVQAMK